MVSSVRLPMATPSDSFRSVYALVSIPSEGLLLAASSNGPLDVARLWRWIESNGTIVYPALALVIIGLIAGALFASWRADELEGERRGELKMKILQVMRRRISGVSAEQIGAELQIDVLLAAKLLNELDQEGAVASARGAGSVPTQYRLRSGIR